LLLLLLYNIIISQIRSLKSPLIIR